MSCFFFNHTKQATPTCLLLVEVKAHIDKGVEHEKNTRIFHIPNPFPFYSPLVQMMLKNQKSFIFRCIAIATKKICTCYGETVNVFIVLYIMHQHQTASLQDWDFYNQTCTS